MQGRGQDEEHKEQREERFVVKSFHNKSKLKNEIGDNINLARANWTDKRRPNVFPIFFSRPLNGC